MGGSKKGKAAPAPVPDPPKTESNRTTSPKLSDGSWVVPLGRRPMDVVYAALYSALFVFAITAVLSADCSRLVPSDLLRLVGLNKDVCPIRSAATQPASGPLRSGTPLFAGLYEQWQREHSAHAAAKASDASLYLLRADVAVNIFLAPFLALIMLRGAFRGQFQLVAVVHAAVTALANWCFICAAEFPSEQRMLSRVSLVFFAGVPLVLLRRWWCEWPFSYKTLQAQHSIVWKLYNAVLSLALLGWLLFSFVQLYDWAVSSHQDLKTLPKAGPTLEHATGAAKAAAQVAYKQAKEAADKAAPIVADHAQTLNKKMMDVLADLGDAVRKAAGNK